MACPWYAGHTMRNVCSIRFGFARPSHANTCQDCSYSYQHTDSGTHRPDLRLRRCTLLFSCSMISRIRRPSPVLLPIAPLRACCCKHNKFRTGRDMSRVHNNIAADWRCPTVVVTPFLTVFSGALCFMLYISTCVICQVVTCSCSLGLDVRQPSIMWLEVAVASLQSRLFRQAVAAGCLTML